MTARKLILQNTFSQVMGKFVTMGATLVITAFITRDLGEAGYGQFTLIMGFAALFYIIVDFGLNAVVARELVMKESLTEVYLRALLFLRVVLSLILYGVGSLALLLLPYSGLVKIGILISLTTILTQALATSVNAVFQARMVYHRATIAVVISSLFLLFYVLIVNQVVPGDRMLYYVLGYVVQGVILVVISFWLARKSLQRFWVLPEWKIVKSIFYASLPLGLMLLFAQVHGKSDILLLSLLPLPSRFGLSTDETLGIYGLAYKVFEVVLVFATFFMNAAYPILVKRFEDNWELFQRSFRSIVWFLLLVGVLGSFVVYLTAGPIINILGGEGFEHSVVALRLLSVGLPIFFVSSAFQWYLVAVNKQRALPVIYLIGASITVVLNLIFVPMFSYVAPAILTWVVEFLILLMMSSYVFYLWFNQSLEGAKSGA